MELRVLDYFLMVAREENITKAAQLLHITQPTLSRQLMQLEKELGVKLFRRSNHHIVLTDDGMLLKRRAQEILSLAHKTKQEFRQEKQLSGEITIGSGEFHSFSFFSTILATFHEQHPSVKFDLFSGNADLIKERLEKGLLDIGLLADPVDISKYEFIRLPVKEVWGVLVRKDSDLGKKAFVTPADLVDQPLMVSPRSLVQNAIAHWFGSKFDQVNFFITYNLLYNVAIMVQKRMGIALCVDLESKYQGLRFIPLSPRLETGCILIWKKDQTLSPLLESFLAHAKKYVSSIPIDS